MTAVLALLSALAFLAVAAAAYFWGRSRQAPEGTQGFALIQQQMEGLRRQLAESLSAQTQTVHQQLESVSRQVSDSQRTVGDVQKSLGTLGQLSERILEVGKDMSSLQEILRAPKLRGGLGEYFLGDLLQQILPARHFELQHVFQGGQVVDAALKLGDRWVSVDAKFPLENFRRYSEAAADEDRRALRKKIFSDVKKHVDAVAQKYILPDEGTYDFALLYIPAENVYYESVIRPPEAGEESLAEYALSRRVVPVSPSSFYAYLQALLLGFRGLRVEENARLILQNLSRLEGDFRRFRDEFEVVGRHLVNAHSKYDEADRRLERLGEKLAVLTHEEAPAGAALETLPK